MLVLGVREGDYIKINDDITIWLTKLGETFKVSIDAPREYQILRGKLYRKQKPELAPDTHNK